MGLRAIYTPEQIKGQTLHSISAPFNRYFQTGGEDLRQLYEGQKRIAAPETSLKNVESSGGKQDIIDFIRK